MKKEEEGICYRYKETIEIRAWKERTLDRYKGDTGIYVYNVTVREVWAGGTPQKHTGPEIY